MAEMHRFSWPMKQTRAPIGAVQMTVPRSSTVRIVISINLLYGTETFLRGYYFNGSHEFPCSSWKPKALYRVHKGMPFGPILSHINVVHALPSSYFKIHLTIILPQRTRSSKYPTSSRFPHQTLMHKSLPQFPSFSTSLIWSIK